MLFCIFATLSFVWLPAIVCFLARCWNLLDILGVWNKKMFLNQSSVAKDAECGIKLSKEKLIRGFQAECGFPGTIKNENLCDMFICMDDSH